MTPRITPSQSSLTRRAFLRGSGLAAAGLGLAACSKKPAGSGGSAELQFMYWGSSYEKTAIEQMLKRFEGSHDGVKVQALYVPGDYITKVNTLVASDSLPDVAYMDAPTSYRLAEQGKIANIYPYIEKYPELADRDPSNFFWYGDKQVTGTPGDTQITVLWYNRDLFTDQIPLPPAAADKAWSWDQMLEVATALTVDQSGKKASDAGFDPAKIRQFGISAPLSTRWTWYPLIRSNGGDITDKSGTTYTLNSPECVKVFQDLQDLVYKHHVAPGPAQLGGGDGSNAPSTTVQLQTKRIAMAIDGQWTLLDLGQSNLNYGIGVLPSYAEPITMDAGACRILSTTTKSLDQAVELYVYSVAGGDSDLYSKGLWMPIAPKDEAAIDAWINNDVHPPEYRTAAVDYRKNNSVRDWTQLLKNVPAINEVVTPAIQEIATGKTPAKQVLDALKDKVQPLLQGTYSIPAQL